MVKDLEPGTVFKYPEGVVLRLRVEGGYVRLDTNQYVAYDHSETRAIIYPDACLVPGDPAP